MEIFLFFLCVDVVRPCHRMSNWRSFPDLKIQYDDPHSSECSQPVIQVTGNPRFGSFRSLSHEIILFLQMSQNVLPFDSYIVIYSEYWFASHHKN